MPTFRHRPRWTPLVVPVVAAVLLSTPVRALATTPDKTQAPLPPPAAANDAALTTAQALTRAKATRTTVQVPAATTPTDTVAANPDGSLTLTHALLPVRKHDTTGAWTTLDATLTRAEDGSITPKATTNELRFSGGGTGPLATMDNSGRSLALSLPMPLPTPSLNGPTATYPNLLPGVDLQVTADPQGGFAEVLVVHNAEAATNPAIQTIALTAHTSGLAAITADTAGNLAATTNAGNPVFTAPTPTMWDSATTAAGRQTSRADAASPPAGGQPAKSSHSGPGQNAHTAAIKVNTGKGKITLTPSRALLDAADTVYPVYIDPTWTPSSSGKSGWATIAAGDLAGTNYWNKTPDPQGAMQVGYVVGNTGPIRSRTLINFTIPSALSGATINTATLGITETRAWNCDPKTINLYAPSTTLTSSNASWNQWTSVNLGGVVDSKNEAHGYGSACPQAAISFNVKTPVATDVTNNKKTQTFALLAADESDDHAWKEFLASSPVLTIKYNHPPNTPTGLTTSPATACPASTPTVIGDATVSLYAPVSDRNGGTLNVTFSLWKTTDPTHPIWPDAGAPAIPATSGTTAVGRVPQDTLDKSATPGATTNFSWKVGVNDGIAATVWSTTCTFAFDTTRAGQPNVTPDDDTSQIGQPLSFTITPPTTGTTPTNYLYQLNGGPAGSTTPSTDDNKGHLTIRPTRFTNVLTVTSQSSTGNIGDTATIVFNSTPADTAPDSDLTGDGAADLLTVGATNNLPAGLWQATGRDTGQIVTAAANIGTNGNGTGHSDNSTDFNQAQVLTGHFMCGGLQDIFAYYPTGADPGHAVVIAGNGDGSIPQAQLGAPYSNPIQSGTFADDNGDNPLQFVNAGTLTGPKCPDLLAINGDPATGYYLDLYPNGPDGGVGAYGMVYGQYSLPAPDGTMNWNNWTIASAPLDSGTSLFLWNPTTHALYLWHITYNPIDNSITHTNDYLLSSNWNPGTTNVNGLHATDIDGNGTPDLWTVGPGATVTAWLVSNLTDSTHTGTITGQTPQTLQTGTHAWTLNDTTDGTATTATDSIGTLNLTGTGNAQWHTGDLYDPDVQLNVADDGTPDVNGTGHLATSTPALATNADFTVSIWAKPLATGGTVLSQDATHTAGFKLWAESSDSSWRFAMPTTDVASPTYNTAAAPPGSVQLGVWTQLTATYNKTTGTMNLYINDYNKAVTTHTTTINATGGLHIGDAMNNNTHTNYFNGQLTQAQTWNTALDPSGTGITTPPAGQWQLDETTGTTAHDAAGLHDATLTGGATWTTPGHTTTDPAALSLNGTTAAATTTGPVLRTNQSFTVTAWVKLTNLTTITQIAVAQSGTHTHAFRLGYYGPNHNWIFRTVPTDTDNAAGSTLSTANNTATAGQWTFLTGVVDAGNTMSFYVNGTLISTATGGSSQLFNATGNLTIGHELWNSTLTDYLNGQVDDVRTYQSALTATDIKTLATATPTAIYHLNETTGTTANDANGLHNATLTTGATWTTPGHTNTDPGTLSLNGTTAAATTGPTLQTNQSFTVTAWAKLNTTGGTGSQAVVDQAGAHAHAFMLSYYGPDNTWRFRTVTSDTDGASGSTAASAGATAGQWTFLTGVYDTTTSTMSFYVNGTLISTHTVGIPFNATSNLNIGRTWIDTANNYYFNGQIDEVRTYQGVLSPAEILKLYNS